MSLVKHGNVALRTDGLNGVRKYLYGEFVLSQCLNVFMLECYYDNGSQQVAFESEADRDVMYDKLVDAIGMV